MFSIQVAGWGSQMVTNSVMKTCGSCWIAFITDRFHPGQGKPYTHEIFRERYSVAR
jgi:hypothetical protein